MSKQNHTGQKTTRKPLSVEDFKKLMTKEQMEAFASACRIKYRTAEPEDYEIVTKHVRALTAKQRDDILKAVKIMSEIQFALARQRREKAGFESKRHELEGRTSLISSSFLEFHYYSVGSRRA
jgi:hypothetical protein